MSIARSAAYFGVCLVTFILCLTLMSTEPTGFWLLIPIVVLSALNSWFIHATLVETRKDDLDAELAELLANRNG